MFLERGNVFLFLRVVKAVLISLKDIVIDVRKELEQLFLKVSIKENVIVGLVVSII